jgi:protein SCO1
MRRRWFVAAVAGAAIIGIAIGVVFHGQLNGAAAAQPAGVPQLHGQATWPAGKRPAPAISLRDQHGKRVTLASLRGSTVALTFFDSLCKESCPIEGKMLGAAIRQVGSASHPRLLVVSVNPAGDTPQTVRRALRKWHLPADTVWLMGARSALKPVWDAYQITVDPVSGDIVHSTAVYLIDRKGDERAGFLMPFIPGLVADDLRLLGREELA